jgi:fructokinase
MTGSAPICFGEVLWDCLPRGRFLGGAPLNLAYHLCKLGRPAGLVSAVGADPFGDETLAALRRVGLATGLVNRVPDLPTGTVTVRLDDAGQASYHIAEPVAWDALTTRPGPRETAPAALVHGSLALRRPANRAVLQAWIAARPALRICDLNLRSPYDDLALLEEYFHGVDLLKVNADEALRLVPAALASDTPARQAEHIADRHACRLVCITLGADGAVLRHPRGVVHAPAPRVAVRDTIGAGDAFTAALLDGLLAAEGAEPDWPSLLGRACALGAFVASRDGAQPDYTPADVPGLRQPSRATALKAPTPRGP